MGICLERSVEMVIGLLGMLKTGGAYLPLDPLSEAAAGVDDGRRSPAVLLTQGGLAERLPQDGRESSLSGY